MRKVIKKFFWAWDFEKEEKWLNEMAAKGLVLNDYSFCRYSFEECEPGEYTHKIQLLEHRPSHPESEMYICFMEETGAEQVASYLNWVYFRKKTAEGPFELFSDYESRIKHLRLIKNLILPFAWLNLIVGCTNIINMIINAPGLTWVPFINIAFAVIAFIGTHKLKNKIKEMKKEQTIME